MKFTARTEDFKEAITRASKGIMKNSVNPNLENIKLCVEDHKCQLISTNLEQYISTKFECVSEEYGEIVFTDTKSLLKAIKFFTDYNISFETGGGLLRIKCGTKGANQPFLDAEEFPGFPTLSENKTTLSSKYSIKKLTDRFKNTNYATSCSDVKTVHMGIHFNGNDMVGCDGVRLAVNKDDSLGVSSPITVPLKTIEFATVVLKNNIAINCDGRWISFSDEETEVVSKLLEGQYLNYRQIMTQTGQWNVPLNIKEFDDGLKYLSTFDNTKAPAPVRFSKNKITMMTSNGTYSSDINTPQYDGEDIGFNARFMMDALKQFKGDVIKLNISGAINPIIITAENDFDNFALVLPVRLNVV